MLWTLAQPRLLTFKISNFRDILQLGASAGPLGEGFVSLGLMQAGLTEMGSHTRVQGLGT